MMQISGFYRDTQKYLCDIHLSIEQSMYLHHNPMDINILYNLNKWKNISNSVGKSLLVGYTGDNVSKIQVYLNNKGEIQQNNKTMKLYPNYNNFNTKNGYLFSEINYEVFPLKERTYAACNFEKRQTELMLTIPGNTSFSECQRETLQQLLLDLIIIFPLNIYKFSITDNELKEFDPEPIKILESINNSNKDSSIFEIFFNKSTNIVENRAKKEFQYIPPKNIVEMVKKRKSNAANDDILKKFSKSFIVGVYIDGGKNIPIFMTQNGEFTDGTYEGPSTFSSMTISTFWPTFEMVRIPYSGFLTNDNVEPLNKTIVVYKFVKKTDASLYIKYNIDNRPTKPTLSGGFIEMIVKDFPKKTGGTKKKKPAKKNYTVNIRYDK